MFMKENKTKQASLLVEHISIQSSEFTHATLTRKKNTKFTKQTTLFLNLLFLKLSYLFCC